MKNLFWKALFFFLSALALWFVTKAAASALLYFRFSKQIEAHIEDWNTKEIAKDSYVLFARYTYEFEGKRYASEGFLKKTYPNPWIADKVKKNLNNNWMIWLNPNHPQQTVMQKSFPLKRIVSAVLIILIAVYFIVLGVVYRRKSGAN